MKQIKLDHSLMSICIEHFQYFNARCAEGRGDPVWSLYYQHATAESDKGWSRSATNRTITGYIRSKKYSQMVTPDDCTCTCKAFEYSPYRTCKHIQVLLLLLWQHDITWVNK